MTLVECFDCYLTWRVHGAANTPNIHCPRCGSGDTVRYLNRRTAALEAALE